MGITSVGHRLTVLKSVYDVKKAQDVPIENDHYVPLCMLCPDRHPSGGYRPPPPQKKSHAPPRAMLTCLIQLPTPRPNMPLRR
jgi:hypothetical protein